MLYLKNTLGGLGRSFTETAAQTFRGPHRWWKLTLYVAMFILPGGSLGVLLFAWLDGRRGQSRQNDAARASGIVDQPAPIFTPHAPARTSTPLTLAALARRLKFLSRLDGSRTKPTQQAGAPTAPQVSSAAACASRADVVSCRSAAGRGTRTGCETRA